jgi:para-aminobenzoate synthetase component 1
LAAERFIEIDHGPGGAPARFAAPRAELIATEPDEVPGVVARAEAALAGGKWLAGYAAYELGYALEPRLSPLMPRGRATPLLCLGVFDGPGAVRPAMPGGALTPLAPRWDLATYARAFERVAEYIRAGDIYQANLTFPLDARWSGDPAALAATLAQGQPVGHGALVRLGPVTLLSRSPELFFALDGRGGIETRPMKGTAPRSADPAVDAALAAALRADEKNRAENLMIVDLLRNDVSRIAEIGSVMVPDLFAIETYATVHQMVSRITGRVLPDARLGGILSALFPCGSVTGAPKVRAMEIIRELEPWPRDAYCGAIGWMAPDGRAAFNVAIRTLALHPDGRAVLNVGGGVVADSAAESEYEEALWKARFAQASAGISG